MNDSDWYLVDRAGRRHGPYERDFVEQLAARQELAADTPLWHPGLARWQPAERILGHHRLPPRNVEPARQAPPDRPQTPSAKPAAQRVRKAVSLARRKAGSPPATAPRPAVPRPATVPAPVPAVLDVAQIQQRVLAAACDLLLVGVLLRLIAAFAPFAVPEWLDSARFALVAWAALEGWLIAGTGTTPGKALLNVTVRGANGARLDERRALLRSAAVPLLLLLVSLGGVATLAGVVALVFAFLRLRAGRGAWWDQMTQSSVSCGELGPGRRLLAGLVVGTLALATFALRRLPQLSGQWA